MNRLALVLVFFVLSTIPAWADKGGRRHNTGNYPPTGVYGQGMPRDTDGGWQRSTREMRGNRDWNGGYWGYPDQRATGRDRAAQVSRGKHKGWYKGKGNQKKMYRNWR